jgi:phosphate-selective porin OprO and OprP
MSLRSTGKRWAAGLVVTGLLFQPLVATAQSRDDLEQRIRELERKLERLERLEGEGASVPAKSKKKKPAGGTTVTTIETVEEEPAAPAMQPHEVKALVQEEIKKTKPIAGWKDGFFLESPGGDFKMKLRGYVQANARWFPNESGDTGTSSFYLRRVRPTIEGTLFKYFDYKIMPDFGGTGGTTITPSIQDAYADVKYWPYARFRAGKFKEPFSLERLQSGTDLLFIERSIANYLAPNRDVGFMLHGDVFQNGLLNYELGIFNGVVDGGSTDGDANSDKDFAGRFFVHPFITTDWDFAKSFGFGFAGTYGNDSDDPIDGTRVRTDGLSTVYRLASGTLGDGIHTRWSPQMYYYWGPFGMMGEYIWSDQSGRLEDEETGETTKGRFTNDGGFIQASYVLTGENASYKRVVPLNNFDPANGYWGAFEIAARASTVGLGNQAFQEGFASRNSSVNNLTAYTVGLNWYLNNAFRFQVNYERAEFSNTISIDGAKRNREDVLLAEFQIAY